MICFASGAARLQSDKRARGYQDSAAAAADIPQYQCHLVVKSSSVVLPLTDCEEGVQLRKQLVQRSSSSSDSFLSASSTAFTQAKVTFIVVSDRMQVRTV